MKVPMRYQNTEYDCGTTSFVNAIAYLFDREDVPVELLKAIYRYTLDVETEGIIGKGGTSRTHAEMLAKYFVKFANETKGLSLKCKILSKDQVNLDDMKKCLDNNGVIAHVFTKSKLSLDETQLLCNVYTDTIYFYLCDEDDNKIALDEDIYLTLLCTHSIAVRLIFVIIKIFLFVFSK